MGSIPLCASFIQLYKSDFLQLYDDFWLFVSRFLSIGACLVDRSYMYGLLVLAHVLIEEKNQKKEKEIDYDSNVKHAHLPANATA